MIAYTFLCRKCFVAKTFPRTALCKKILGTVRRDGVGTEERERDWNLAGATSESEGLRNENKVTLKKYTKYTFKV
jgi:hypothetical protein